MREGRFEGGRKSGAGEAAGVARVPGSRQQDRQMQEDETEHRGASSSAWLQATSASLLAVRLSRSTPRGPLSRTSS